MGKRKNSSKEFWDTDQFKQLNKEWYAKLKKSGFEDAEDGSGMLKAWHNTYFIRENELSRESKEEFFRRAGQFLHEHNFETKTDYVIWELYSQGLSCDAIDKKIRKSIGLAKRTVAKLKKKMWDKNSNNE